MAIEAMREVQLDLTGATSKSLTQFDGQSFDYVVTVCDNAKEDCPVFPAVAKMVHWSFDDPASATGNDEQKMRVFRRVRDEIRHRVRRFVEARADA
jgi:arsenate reductase